MKLIAIAAGSLFLALGPAHAQFAGAPLYGELGYSFLEVKDFGFKTNPQALRGIVGYNFHPYLAAEAMAGFGTSDDSDGALNVKLRNMFGLYAKPKYTWNNAEVFARLGWAHTSVRASSPVRSTTDKDDDFSWGVGANYNFNPKMYVGADWMRYTKQDHIKVQGVTVSFGYRF
jgi:outer membrane autotransporter protein